MLKIFLLHHIYEWCINLIFQYFTNNFSNTVNIENIKLNDKFKNINVYDFFYSKIVVFNNVRIIHFNEVVFLGEFLYSLSFIDDKMGKIDHIIGKIVKYSRYK